MSFFSSKYSYIGPKVHIFFPSTKPWENNDFILCTEESALKWLGNFAINSYGANLT